ncbi:hypothetical protein CTAM01_11685 [Colletotrichum tamarilloi]|uniref:Ankyrin repeat protein n=1 Tax=Colletotrichum tamarilloi TaxID=1209934 RepID=A0ABQ9QWY2_9PEZI|nr:uncharacterized protein CTAM01_11685 [Colletotrichum tamarilloi]KAK1487652.1 hypothetical protein CTAM01_11685 [Colletotrichum tamarilloi]
MAEPAEHDSDDEKILTSPPPEGFSPEAVRRFLDLFRKEDAQEILFQYDAILPHNAEFDQLLRWVTDPTTGDTAVHVAASARNIGALGSHIESFGRDWSANPWLLTCFRAPFFLRNKAGDTVFHVAARTGRLDVVNGVWRVFWLHPGWNQPSYESGSDAYAPVCEDLGEFEHDPEQISVPEYMVAIVLLARKNGNGYTAADEAAAAGHHDVAQWLRLMLERLTLGNKRATESRMARMEELVDNRYDIDGHHVTPDQLPYIRRWTQFLDGRVISGDY